MTLAILALVFVSDALADYLAGRYLDARQDRRRHATVGWAGAIALFASINLLGFVQVGFVAIPAAVGGAMLGTYLSFES